MHQSKNGLFVAQMITLTIASQVLFACTGGGAGSGVTSSSVGASSAPMLVANSAMKDAEEVYASPLDGGLSGNLYIQPRNTMIAQDTETVGCGQAGNGALGIASYLANPSWITQNVLFTELYVPTRNFSMGFPAPAGNGAVLDVHSYFVIDVKGYFHLAPGETEGDYQFAMIADDGGNLKVGSDGNYTTLIDDEKPASVDNGTCLKQTQSAHMSCSTDWSNQSTTKMRTLHIKPGDAVPLQLQYWQGPGYGLSMMAFYRKVSDKTNPATMQDSSCGQEWGYGEGEESLKNVLKTWSPISFNNLNAFAG